MKQSFTIVKIAGTRVQLHFTFIILLFIVGAQYYFTSGIESAVRGVLFIAGVFLCVLLHEFGHVTAALKYGITTPKITLLPIGGMASLSRIPKQPVHELVVAIAGPAVNVAIATVLILFRGSIPSFHIPVVTQGDFSFLDALIWVNLFLAAFNLIPVFPMDGGRIFRAILAMFLPRGTATHFAAKVGQFIAVAGGIWAVMNGQIMLTILAIFIIVVGKGEEAMVDQELLLEGHTAGEAAMTDFKVFTLDDTLQAVIDRILKSDQDSFPIVNDMQDCIAALSFNEVIAAIQRVGPDSLVRDAVHSVPEQISEDYPAYDALQKLVRSPLAGVAVVDGKGHLKKWLTKRQFGEFMMVQALVSHQMSGSVQSGKKEMSC